MASPSNPAAFAQQAGIGDHHQLVGPRPLGDLQHQIRAYARRFTRGDGKTMAVHPVRFYLDVGFVAQFIQPGLGLFGEAADLKMSW